MKLLRQKMTYNIQELISSDKGMTRTREKSIQALRNSASMRWWWWWCGVVCCGGGSNVELNAHLCRYTSVGAPNQGGRTPGSQTPGVPATLGLNVQMDGGRKMLQNCSKLPITAAKTATAESRVPIYCELECPPAPVMN